MRPIITDRVAWSVCRSDTVVSPAKTAEPIEMPFGLRTYVDPGNHVLSRGSMLKYNYFKEFHTRAAAIGRRSEFFSGVVPSQNEQELIRI